MSSQITGKYIYDDTGAIVEVILPIDEFLALKRRAGEEVPKSSRRVKKRTKSVKAPSATEMTQIALHGGAFEWLKAEPDIYSDNDGEPV